LNAVDGSGQKNEFEGVRKYFGKVLEVWEGYSADEEIRHHGASGGILTGLACYGMEVEKMSGVLHIGQDDQNPLANKTYLSKSRRELLSRTGSRYAPASACDRLDLIEKSESRCVFIGQPSEAAAYRKAQRMRPQLDAKTGLVLSFFCAGSPSTKGNQELLRKAGIDPRSVREIRYRGRGWPGNYEVFGGEHSAPLWSTSYADCWAFLQAFRPYAVHLFPDTSGEYADISGGDPWYREKENGESGSSLIVVRTERGREILERAMKAGRIVAKRVGISELMGSQKNLAAKRGAVWGRQLAFRTMGIPTTRYRGFGLFASWFGLPMGQKLASVLGTLRRIIRRKYYKRREIHE
jgi:coenzyme F420 hydrogenase subunit beta